MTVVFTLVLARVAGLFVGAPMFSRTTIPPRFRWLLTAGVAASVLPAADPAMAPRAIDGVIVGMIGEFAVGMAIGLLARFLLAAFQLAGAIVSFQMGFAVANAFDPDSGRSTPILSTLHLQLVSVLFLLLDGHHILIRGLASSYESFPLGGPIASDVLAQTMFASTRSMYELGARVAGPVSGLMLLINATVGFLNRVVPQLSIFSIGFPMTVLSGLVAVTLSIPEVVSFFMHALESFRSDLAVLTQG